jgi:catechol 2,3-dioxygenase-like lactoylglutathione lyase family enzyme
VVIVGVCVVGASGPGITTVPPAATDSGTGASAPRGAGERRRHGRHAPANVRDNDAMATVTVRYIVDDVDDAIAFYVDHLGFRVVMHPAPSFAMLDRPDLRLLLSAPSGQGGGGQILPGDRRPEPGGWNRFQLLVDDLAGEVERLRQRGVTTRSEIVHGIGGDQVIIDDPSGNPVELFAPTSGRNEERRTTPAE